jgi:arylsulfatase A-like enzyme
LILADDLGYGDVSCYGAHHARTPHIDELAAQGSRFTDAHSPASTCTPTRSALLTGRYAWRQEPGSSIAPGDAPLFVPAGTPTIASILKQAGYATGAVGKWHLGLGDANGPDWNGDLKPGPLEIGFDYCFLMPATGDRVPCVYIENHRVVGLDPNDPIQVSYKSKVGNEPTGKENPELLKLKHTRGHDFTIINGIGRIGWMAGGHAARWNDEQMADTFAAKSIAFMERVEKTNPAQPFFLYLATQGIHVPRVPHPRFKGSSPSGTRGDAIQELDDTVGQVLAALERLKLADKTLVIFTSDNGGVMDNGYEDVGSFDYNPNAPLRGEKGSLYEGGHRIPLIARWPGHIRPGTTNSTLITHLDFAATFAALVGVPVPDYAADSFNVLPALLGEKTDAPLRPYLVAHTGGTKGPFAIRKGDWVLVQPRRGKQAPQPKTGKKVSPGELFNLQDDLGEAHDLAAEHPEKVAELQALLKKAQVDGRTRP